MLVISSHIIERDNLLDECEAGNHAVRVSHSRNREPGLLVKTRGELKATSL